MTAGRLDGSAALRAAAAVEAGSEHPIARAIVAAAAREGVDVPAATGFLALPGNGARATIRAPRSPWAGPTSSTPSPPS